jgi:agmatinase
MTSNDNGNVVGLPDGRQVPRYAGPDTFARLPRMEDLGGGTAAVAVAGIPFDSGVSYRPGARFGPHAVRQASKMLRPYHPVLDTHPFDAHQVADAGDISVNPFDISEAIGTIERAVGALLGSADRLLAIGGDHTIALPLLRATAAKYGPVSLVHFDAHLDTWDTYFGAPYTHGTPFRRAVEEGLLALDTSAHVGIRSPLYAYSDLTDDKELGFATVTTADVARHGTDQAIDRIRERVGDRPVYLTSVHPPRPGGPEPGRRGRGRGRPRLRSCGTDVTRRGKRRLRVPRPARPRGRARVAGVRRPPERHRAKVPI